MVKEVKQEEKKRSWFRRHWIWTIVICLFLLIMINAVIFSSTTSSPSNSNSGSGKETNSAVISGSLESFFPTRDEIPTEFTINSIANVDVTNVQNAEGIKSAKSMNIDKIEGTMGDIAIDMFIGEFSSQEQAKSHYDSLVNEKKQAGGYSEMSISSKSTCFGYTENYGITAKSASVLCYYKNIYFEIDGMSSNTFTKSNNDVKSMLSIIDRKIR